MTLVAHSELKWGPLEKIVEDTSITDIAILPDGSLWIDRGNGMERYPTSPFKSSSHIREYAVGLCAQLNTRLDQGAPIGDASSLSGVRIHAEIEPIVSQGASISLRFPRSEYVSLRYLKEKKMISDWMELFFKEVISKKMSVLIIGATGSGKTTLMKALLEECPSHERIVIVEESRELGDLQRENYVSLMTRAPNIEKKGEITLSDLVRATLRMRPDRIVVGECRGREIIDLMRAFTSGHAGGFSTLHAHNIQGLSARLYALGELAHISPSLIALLSSQAFDLVVHCERINGLRVVSQIGILRAHTQNGETILQSQIVAFLSKNIYGESDYVKKEYRGAEYEGNRYRANEYERKEYERKEGFCFTQEWNTFIESNHFSSQWLYPSFYVNEIDMPKIGVVEIKGDRSEIRESRGKVGENKAHKENVEEGKNDRQCTYEEYGDNTKEFPKISRIPISQMLE